MSENDKCSLYVCIFYIITVISDAQMCTTDASNFVLLDAFFKLTLKHEELGLSDFQMVLSS